MRTRWKRRWRQPAVRYTSCRVCGKTRRERYSYGYYLPAQHRIPQWLVEKVSKFQGATGDRGLNCPGSYRRRLERFFEFYPDHKTAYYLHGGDVT